MPAKNMLNTVTTWARPPRIWPARACDGLATRPAPLAEIDVAEHNHRERRAEHDQPGEGLDREAAAPTHRLGDRRQTKVVVASRRRRRADEDAVNEEGHRHFLHPQHRISQRAGHDIE